MKIISCFFMIFLFFLAKEVAASDLKINKINIPYSMAIDILNTSNSSECFCENSTVHRYKTYTDKFKHPSMKNCSCIKSCVVCGFYSFVVMGFGVIYLYLNNALNFVIRLNIDGDEYIWEYSQGENFQFILSKKGNLANAYKALGVSYGSAMYGTKHLAISGNYPD